LEATAFAGNSEAMAATLGCLPMEG